MKGEPSKTGFPNPYTIGQIDPRDGVRISVGVTVGPYKDKYLDSDRFK